MQRDSPFIFLSCISLKAFQNLVGSIKIFLFIHRINLSSFLSDSYNGLIWKTCSKLPAEIITVFLICPSAIPAVSLTNFLAAPFVV